MLKKIISNFASSAKNQISIKINAQKKGLFDEVAKRQDFASFAAILNILPNPDSVLKKQGKNISIYRELSYDSQVFTCIQSRKSGVTSQKWRVVQGKSNDDVFNFVTEMFEDLDMISILNGILEAPLYGYQPIEIIWDYKNGKVVPVDLVAKPPEWFSYNQKGILCYKKAGSTNGIEIIEENKKFLVPRSNPSYFNPYGESVLSRVFWPVAFKKGGLKFWSIFSEKYGMPYILGKYNKGQSQEEIDSLADSLENMVQDAIAVIPNDSSVEIQNSADKSSSIQVYKEFVSYNDASTSKVILGQTLTTDAGKSGSYALGKVHSGVRQDIVLADKRICESTLNKLIQWAVELNKGDMDCPTFSIYEEDGVNKEQAETDKIIADILEKDGRGLSDTYLMRTYNYQTGDIVKVSKTDNTTNFAADSAKSSSIKLPSADQLDSLSESLDNQKLQAQIESILNPVLKLFEETQDPQAVLDKLAESYPKMDTKQLEALLTKVIFISEAWGMISNE